MKRPSCLKGAEKVYSATIRGGSRLSHVYVKDDDVFLHIRDMFSSDMSFPDREDMMLPTAVLFAKYPWLKRKGVSKFVYCDAWCRFIACNEGVVGLYGMREALSEGYGLFDRPHLPSISMQIADDILAMDGRQDDVDEYAACLRRFIDDMVLKIYSLWKKN